MTEKQTAIIIPARYGSSRLEGKPLLKACNKPIITTRYGEMREFEGKEGFIFIDNFDSETIMSSIEIALQNENLNTRESVVAYDWEGAVHFLQKEIN